MGPLDGRVAVVTGAGGGIGREHALALARAGAHIVVNDIGVDLDGSGGSIGPAEAVVSEIKQAGGRATASLDSVADYDASGRVIATALDVFGRVDVLVNNAGVFRGGPFESVTPEDFAAEVAVHLTGTFNTCKHALPVMVAQGGGRVINTTSSSWHAGCGLAGYAAVKAGVLGLSFDLATEYVRRGVTVNVLSPVALTDHRVVQGERWLEKLRAAGLMEDFLAAIPSDGPGDAAAQQAGEPPDHIPPLVVYLASEAAAAITGKVFEVRANVIGLFAHPAIEARIAKDPHSGPWTHEELVEAMPRLLSPGGRSPGASR